MPYSVSLPSDTALQKVSYISTKCVTVECPGMNPDCHIEIRKFLWKYSTSLLKTSFSNTFPTEQRYAITQHPSNVV